MGNAFFADVVLCDPGMRAVHEQAARAAGSSLSVLLLGETGVGKEILARAIHAGSRRAAGPFVAVNCAAIAESLLEAELFGAERGAYTGAVTSRAGLFEAANGGTLFLDEVADMPLMTQCKLLRVLEERVVRRVGATHARPIDLRVVAATNRELAADSHAGRFRPDLYFRLAGFTLVIPPLRARTAEIEPLTQLFARAASRELELPAPVRFSAEALALVRAYHWPGNIRELKNVVQRAAVLCAGDVILAEHLPPALLGPQSSATAPPVGGDRSERERIVEALRRCAGNQTRAANLLGISRGTLVSRLSALDLPRPRKRIAGPPPALPAS